jgi:hypothetical protein
MDNNLRIDTGVITLTINDGPNTLQFNPSDVLFAEKFYRLMEALSAKIAEYKEWAARIDADKSLDESGMPKSLGEAITFTKTACGFFRAEIDALFGAGSSQKLFGDVVSLQAIGQFFNGITPHIGRARESRVAKYRGPVKARKK